MKRLIKYRIYLLLLLGIGACEGFLDEKPSVSLVVPNSLDDLQALLDNSGQTMNQNGSFTLMRSDEFVADESLLESELAMLRDVYLWEPNPYAQDDIVLEWSRPYEQILIANTVLEIGSGLEPNTVGEKERKKHLIGAAHFYRAHAYFELAQVFAPAYSPDGDNSTLCFPLRDVADPNRSFGLATVGEAYEFILQDMDKALELLPAGSEIPTRPNLTSGKALMARIYLSMGIYDMAGEYAEQVLSQKSDLKNFREISASGINPFTRFNSETIFYTHFSYSSFTFSQLFKVSEDFLSLYAENDLRKSTYFIQRPGGWKNQIGHYSGSIEYFSGITTAEMMLIAAESAARSGNQTRARELLAVLAENRFGEGLDPDFTAISNEDLLSEILDERKRELFGRGLRWSDLKRLNREERFAITLSREYGESTIMIPPNDSRYVSVIPPREIDLDSF
jgi:tetratricopeptide (TPR) repeat protein